MNRQRREEATKAYVGAAVCALALAIGWVLLLPHVPWGWPVIAVNGVAYMLSIVILAGLYEQLKRAVRPFHAFLLATGTWFFTIVLVRRLFVMLLDAL
ncbi:MAG: hypothetical protein IMY84_04555 [Chloroflexi bacterium]|nr:hypothetical protein [Chloroflexota bacterium]